MPSEPEVQMVQVQGKDIDSTVRKIVVMVEGIQPNVVLMSCIAIVLMIEKPHITGAELKEGIMETSRWITEYLGGVSGVELRAKEVVN